MRKNKLTQTLTKGLRLVFIVALATGLTLGVAPVPVAHAATITVNSTADNTIGNDGNCTLREAINNANQNLDTTGGDCTAGQAAPAIDTITLPAGTYTLGGIPGEDLNVGGDLDILQTGGDLTINGAGAGSTIIDGGYNDRVFHIDPPAAGGLTVNISGVTIQHGRAAVFPNRGGGIFNRRSTVNIADSTLSGNLTTGPGGLGGGIANENGTVNITNSTLSSNQTTSEGGGIFNGGPAGIANVVDSTLSGNWSSGGPGPPNGGGIRNRLGCTVNITNTTLSSNVAIGGNGGAINNDGTANIADSTLSSNTATGGPGGSQGGGIYNWNGGALNITNSTLSSNTASGGPGSFGGGIFNGTGATASIANSTLSGNQTDGDGGGIYNTGGTVNIADSTISSNTATGGPGSQGGGIYSASPNPVNIANTTVSGNQTNGDGGGIRHTGTAINLDNLTITNNTADNDGDNIGDGGGIYYFGPGPFTLKNTIVAQNSDNTAVGNVHPDCSSPIPPFTSGGYNLIGDGAGSAGLTHGVNNDQVGSNVSPIDPLLGPLADNGGPTFTHALLAGSPAIDAGICTDISLNPVTTDQRGVARPQGATCDIGAYEADPRLSIDKTVTPATDVTYHGVVTYTVVLSNTGAAYASGVLLTDTLPSEVDFANWVEQPTNAIEANDQITWSGTVSATTAITFALVVTHTGHYGDVVTNTVEYSNTISGSDYVTFTVVASPTTYLPIIQTNNVITP